MDVRENINAVTQTQEQKRIRILSSNIEKIHSTEFINAINRESLDTYGNHKVCINGFYNYKTGEIIVFSNAGSIREVNPTMSEDNIAKFSLEVEIHHLDEGGYMYLARSFTFDHITPKPPVIAIMNESLRLAKLNFHGKRLYKFKTPRR